MPDVLFRAILKFLSNCSRAYNNAYIFGNRDKTQGPRRGRMNDGEQLEIRAVVTLQVLEKDLSNCSNIPSTSLMIHDTSVNVMDIYQRIAGSQYPSIIFC